MRRAFFAAALVVPLVAVAQPARKQLTDAVDALEKASTLARRAGGQCRQGAERQLADAADRLDAQGARVRYRDLAELLELTSNANSAATFSDCPEAVSARIASAMESLEALRVALWAERKDERSGEDSMLAQLAPLLVNVNDTFEGEPAVRVSVPELTLKGLQGQTFSLGARFRSLQGHWSEWVITQQWSVPANPFVWKNAFTHLMRASRLAEEDFAGGAFIARVSVFDGNGRELAFREKRFQVSLAPLPAAQPVAARDCGTGQDLGCNQVRDGVFPLDRISYLGLGDALRAEKNEKKRLKKFETAGAAVYLTAAQFTSLFPTEGPRFEAATAMARRVVNLHDAVSYAARFKSPELRAKYGSLLRSILDPGAAPRAWRVEGDMDYVGFTFEEPTREAVYTKCIAWKEGNIRLQGYVTRVAVKGGATRTDMIRSDAACGTVRDGSVAVY